MCGKLTYQITSYKLNILLLLQDYYDPKMPARPAVIEIYGKYMPSLGHNILWISSNKDSKKVKKEIYNLVPIYTVPYSTGSNPLSKFYYFLKYYGIRYKLVSHIIKKENIDIIKVRNGVFDSLIAIYFKKKYKIPFVFQYSFQKETFKSKSSKKISSYLLEKFLLYLQKYVLNQADFIFPISKYMELKLIKEGISESKMIPLPMGVNSELFSLNIDSLKLRDQYFLNDAKVILYLGTMDKTRHLDIVLYAFSKVIMCYSNVKLLMVGDGNDRLTLEKLSTKLKLNANVIFTGKVPYFDIPYFISMSDICLSPIPPLDMYKVSSPTKLFEYMVMCKPVVANGEIPEQKEVIEKSCGGVLVSYDAESFFNGIVKLLNNSEMSENMGQNGYRWVTENRSYRNMAHELEKIYFNLLNSCGKIN